MQTFTFYASDDKLSNRGHTAAEKFGVRNMFNSDTLDGTLLHTNTCSFSHQSEAVNQAACDLAREVANEGGALVAGNITHTPSYMSGKGKEVVQAEFKKQVDVFVKNNVDFLIGEVLNTILLTYVTEVSYFLLFLFCVRGVRVPQGPGPNFLHINRALIKNKIFFFI